MKAKVKITNPSLYTKEVDDVILESCKATWIGRHWFIQGDWTIRCTDGVEMCLSGSGLGDEHEKEFGFIIVGDEL